MPGEYILFTSEDLEASKLRDESSYLLEDAQDAESEVDSSNSNTEKSTIHSGPVINASVSSKDYD